MSEPMRPEPDEKDWTWVMRHPCAQCGFDPAGVEPVALPLLFGQALSSWPAVLAHADVAVRPAPQTWSPLEYACHVRDVLGCFTGRVALMLQQDEPTFPSWDHEAAAVTGRYWEQDPPRVSGQLQDAGEQAAVAFGSLEADQWRRRGTRGDGAQFTVETIGVYLLHELVHHAGDVAAAPAG